MTFIEPKTIEVKTINGDMREYVISRFPSLTGRSIFAGYPLTALPKFADYKDNEAMMIRLMGHVGVAIENGDVLPLSTAALIDNHVPDWQTLAKLELATLQYNCAFGEGKSLNAFGIDLIKRLVANAMPKLKTALAEANKLKMARQS